MNENRIFTAAFEKSEASEATAIAVPFDAAEAFGAKQAAVCGSLNGAGFRGTIVSRSGRYLMVVNKKLREAAGAKAGDAVRVEMKRDSAPRTIEAPEDLQIFLDGNPAAKEIWEKLSFTHQKEYAQAIDEAKKPETRERRVRKTIEKLLEKISKT